MNNNKKYRFIALYLPQFHPIPENDRWWGPGFTEWRSVVNAKRLFPGHYQPNLPADLGFYDLRIPEVREIQAKMARDAGIEGFCYWHYWFGNGKRLLEMPFNEVVKSGEPDFPFCLAWANHSWEKKLWDKNGTSELLIEQTYPGKEDYLAHFNTLLPAFKDKRYIKVNNKLFFLIHNPSGIPDINDFLLYWRGLAKQNGLNDFYFVARDADSRNKQKYMAMGFDAIFNDDVFNIHHHLNIFQKVWYWIFRNLFHIPSVFSYKKAVRYMINEDCRNISTIPIVAPNWDHSPRSGGKSILLHKPHPKYFKQVIEKAIDVTKEKPEEERIIIVKSWNEWGEGNYMEPDARFGKGNLDAMKSVLCNED